MAARKKAKEFDYSLYSGSSGYLDRDVAPLMAALKAYIKESTSSPEAAKKSLISAGIMDKNGRIKKRYRP